MAPAPTPPTTEMSNLTVQETAPAPGFKGTVCPKTKPRFHEPSPQRFPIEREH